MPALRRSTGDRSGAVSIEVEIAPFWMGKFEVTWAEYRVFMELYDSFKGLASMRPLLAPDLAERVADEGPARHMALAGNTHRLSGWMFLEWDERDVEARFREFSTID